MTPAHLASGVQHILITGGAGFSGRHPAALLLRDGFPVTVVDSVDPFYPRPMKARNIAAHRPHPACRVAEADLRDAAALAAARSGRCEAIDPGDRPVPEESFDTAAAAGRPHG